MTITRLAEYTNGNCLVSLFSDGTKTCEWDGIPVPIFPCSIDLKITDYCDAGCVWCHEKSTRKGTHGNAEQILKLLDGLPAGTELAIGGGNPLDFPELENLLTEIRKMGLIPNLTVNAVHINRLTQQIRDLVYGLGISWNVEEKFAIRDRLDSRSVLHVIAGVHNPREIVNFAPQQLLILGYKRYGRGVSRKEEAIEENLRKWRYWLPALCNNSKVAFDNLALEQLDVKKRVNNSIWDNRFMGEDGKFTMYIDGVRMEYAATSTTTRFPASNKSVEEMFAHIRQN